MKYIIQPIGHNKAANIIQNNSNTILSVLRTISTVVWITQTIHKKTSGDSKMYAAKLTSKPKFDSKFNPVMFFLLRKKLFC